MSIRLPLVRNAHNLRGKRVLLRLDTDAPIERGRLRDTYRIDCAAKTLEFLREQKAETLIIGHIGRGPTETLAPVHAYLAKQFPIAFVSTLPAARQKLSAAAGAFVMLENLRQFSGETKNDPAFARELASLAALYVNEAFAVSHREHASIVGLPKLLPSYAGFQFEAEVSNLSKAFSPTHPMLLILGGAKFETKIPLISRFLALAGTIYVCGALANDIYRVRGYETGVSLVSDCALSQTLLDSPKVHVPSDVIVRGLAGSDERDADMVGKDDKIVDAGTDALADLRALIGKAKFVLWNGPLGEYEAGFDAGTIALAEMLAECDAETIIGGGDSLAVVSKLGLLERFSFVSTGGGAMLEFLAKGTLPGIDALLRTSPPFQGGD